MRKCEELLKCVQKSRDSRLNLAGGSRLQAARLMHMCQACQKLKRHANCSLQDKSPKLARPFARGLNSWLNQVTRSTRQNTLFGKIWRFTFLLILLYIYPYTQDSVRASRENFKRETLKKTRLTHPQSLPKRFFKFLYSLPLHCYILERFITQILFSPYPYLWEGYLVLGKQLGRDQWLLVDAIVK